MKTICVCTTVHSPWDVRIYAKEIKTLLKAYRVIYVAPDGDSPTPKFPSNLTYIPLKKGHSRILRMIRTLAVFRILMSLRHRIVAYHVHDPELSICLTLLKILTQKKCVYDVHENHVAAIRDRFWIKKPLRKIMASAFLLIEKVCISFFDDIICASPEIQNLYHVRNTSVIENLPSTIHYRSVVASNQKKPQIILAGALTRVRGILQSVQAFIDANLPDDFQLLLLGWFESEGFKGQILEMLFNSDKRDRFQHIPWVPYHESVTYLQESAIGLVPYLDYESHRFGFPNKIYEFMATGTPIIYSDLPNYVNAIGQYGVGLAIDCSNPREIGRAMEKLAHNPKIRREMGTRGRHLFLTRFNWERQQERLLNIYDEIQGSKQFNLH